MNQESTPQKRVLPQSELDLNLMLTDPVWGKVDISPGLRSKLNKYFVGPGEKVGEKKVTVENLWELLGFYTRDMRLANLSVWNNEFQYVSYHLDLANDLLEAGMVDSFLIALARAATVLELSQSKNGFLRRRQHTFSQENIQANMEPEKRSLFGGMKKKQQQ